MSIQVTEVNDGAQASKSTSGVQRRGNVASLKTLQTDLTAIDAYGGEFKVPDYTIKDILKSIPAHCYERRAIESMYYVFRDIAAMVFFGYLANNYIEFLPNKTLRFLAWSAHIYIQGLFGTGLWVLAHECGHSAFSDYGRLNDTVGWLLHSYWLVPYFSWKFSHSKHHKATGNMNRDMVFVPKTKEGFLKSRGIDDLDDLVGDSPLYTLMSLMGQQLGGWILYLLTNITGQEYPGEKAYRVNHFNPSSLIFDKRDYWYIVISDIGILLQMGVLYNWYKFYGGFNLLVNWALPYLWVNHWLVFITFLQHSDPKIAHYEPQQWNFARGAACTIDREFGFVGKHIFHDIIETHVLHHYISRIPFYNAREATEEIKKVMGHHYQHNEESMWTSLWKVARYCQYVDGDNGVLMYRNINGAGVGTDPK